MLSAFASDCRAGSAARGRTLVAVRAVGRADPGVVPESPAWLEALRRRLAPRLPLGDRVAIVAPRYVPIRLSVKLTVVQDRDAAGIIARAKRLLEARFSIVKACPDDTPWPLGRDVRANDVAGWLLKLPGVIGIPSLYVGTGPEQPAAAAVPLPRDGLPQLRLESGDIAIEPAAKGARR
jgi:phage-related baseplate assembly protein